MSEEFLIEAARERLLAFAVAMNRDYEIAYHHKMIARKIHELTERKVKHLMVFMPPRHGKSMLISELLPAWYLGRNPTHQVIFTSYSQDVASDFGRKVRNTMGSDEYRGVFPDIHIQDDSHSTKRFHTNSGGAYFAAGAGGALTGRGADLIIVDDIHKNRDESHSDTITKSIKDWYGSTLYTRRMKDAVVVIVQTRWSEKDLPQHLLDTEGEKWDVLSLPAIDESNQALWPERFPMDTLLEIKKTIGSYDFEALYQQRPSALEGSIIKRSWLKFYKQLPKMSEKLQSWDLTFKEGENSDYVAGQVWGSVGSDKYLIDSTKARMDFPTTIQAIRQMSYKHPDTYTKVIEDKANGSAAIATLTRELSGIVPFNPKTSKEARLQAVSPDFEAGNIYLPDPSIAPWVGDFVEELCAFPNGAHDDQVDAMTMALLRFRESSGDRIRRLITM